MTILLWLYQFIGAVFLGFMICTACIERPKPFEWVVIVGLAVFWPYAFYLIYRQERKA